MKYYKNAQISCFDSYGMKLFYVKKREQGTLGIQNSSGLHETPTSEKDEWSLRGLPFTIGYISNVDEEVKCTCL